MARGNTFRRWYENDYACEFLS